MEWQKTVRKEDNTITCAVPWNILFPAFMQMLYTRCSLLQTPVLKDILICAADISVSKDIRWTNQINETYKQKKRNEKPSSDDHRYSWNPGMCHYFPRLVPFIIKGLVNVSCPAWFLAHLLPRPSEPHYRQCQHSRTNQSHGSLNTPLEFGPSPVRNMLSFFPILLLLAKSFHLFFPSSSSRVALTLRGTFAGRAGPSLALLGSLRA